MNNFHQKIQNFLSDMQIFSDAEEKFLFLIEKGKELNAVEGWYYPLDARIKTCTSKTWFTCQFEDYVLKLHGNSQSFIICGIIALLKELMDGESKDSINTEDIHQIFKLLLKNFSHVRQPTINVIQERILQCIHNAS